MKTIKKLVNEIENKNKKEKEIKNYFLYEIPYQKKFLKKFKFSELVMYVMFFPIFIYEWKKHFTNYDKGEYL